MSVNLQGSIASVCVKEKDTPPEIIPEKEVCNIKAKCDGQIIMIQVFKGEAEVKMGTLCQKANCSLAEHMTMIPKKYECNMPKQK